MLLRSFQLAHVMWPAWGHPAEAAAAASPLPLVLRCLAQALATGFHRFLARFSGRRRSLYRYNPKYPPPWAFLVLVLASSFVSIVDACSSRTTPKPRPPAPTARPNITFHTYECPPAYAAWYCLNGATCFTVKIGDSLLYNCECAEGFMGPRCEYKDLDGSYLPSQRRFMLETASIAGGATIAVFLVVIVCVVVYLQYKRYSKMARAGSDCVDGHNAPLNTPTFGTRWRTIPPADIPAAVQEAGDSKEIGWNVMRSQPYTHPINRDVCSA
ncbi:probetacellulin-like isoform X1 [Zophobas morio]|uniref:probetacellulin-like isoform X1 n=2 Tax=Zophobas morio TaxID=2755281 RepID=UPI003083AB3A